MSIQLLKKLPTPTEIKADYPVTQKVAPDQSGER